MLQAKNFIIDKAWKFIIKDLGLKPAEILKRASLPEDLFVRENASLTTDEYFRLWLSLEAILNNPAFPLLIGEMITAETFSPPIFAAFCSPNMNIAMHRLSRYKQLIGPMTLDVQEFKTSTTLTIDCLYREHPLPHSLMAMELIYLVNLVRMATREKIVPISVTTAVELLEMEKYEAYFGVRPRIGKKNQLVFSYKDALIPFLSENQRLWEFFEPELRKRLSDIEEETSFSNKVRSSLLELIPSGLCTSAEVARKLAVSKRTLQRHLNNENTTFQKILNSTREKLARHYLQNSSMSGAEIAFLLGFDDPNSFFRAFRSWTGETPGRLRIA